MEDSFNEAIDAAILDQASNEGLTTEEMIRLLEAKVKALKEGEL